MHENLRKKPDLLIVSDTPMWQVDGKNLAFEPVVREIENFYPLFDKITWIGFKHEKNKMRDSAVTLKNARVKFVFLNNIGGKSLISKLKILLKIPVYFYRVYHHIKKHDVIHARGPSIPAFFTLMIADFITRPVYWYKYAGNWELENPPLSYKLQKDYLKKHKKVIGTINGYWPGQQKHLISFENPCFTGRELQQAKETAISKSFSGDLDLLFVGRIEERKGFDRLLSALADFKPGSGLGTVYFVGGGGKKAHFEKLAEEMLAIDYVFTGPLKREALNNIYSKAHIFCLPSLSEGFPKVLAESAAFGCIPVVSDLSCIGQYIIHGKNGLLLKEISPGEIRECLVWILEHRESLKAMSQRVNGITDKFTYEYYNERIRNDILSHLA
ncbi:MAG: glycosyltransferase [Cytophagales bacterium]|nr:glycosyltransferase [Cytophagales bacterium]